MKLCEDKKRKAALSDLNSDDAISNHLKNIRKALVAGSSDHSDTRNGSVRLPQSCGSMGSVRVGSCQSIYPYIYVFQLTEQQPDVGRHILW